MRSRKMPAWADEYITWDTCEFAQAIAEEWVEEGRYANEDDAFSAAIGDSDLQEDEWEYVCDWLTEFMETVAKDNTTWSVAVNNFGWMHQSGYKRFDARDGKKMLREVLPDTDCLFYIYLSEDKKSIIINNSHHDAPMGGEMYFIWAYEEQEDEEDE